MKFKKVLAIESSCDDTSVAVVTHTGYVDAMVSANQDLAHEPFGGVVPEIAGRNHTHNILPLIEECLAKSNISWSEIDGIAVTSRPGLVGSLIVGLVTAKTLGLTKDKPFIGVNHLEGHILAPFLSDDKHKVESEFKYPYLCLAVSGGHTQIYLVTGEGKYSVLGQTIDDAAGEAFDKFAKTMGLGFPGGVRVDELAQKGDEKAYKFPRPLLKEEGYRFSFSGLKTAALRQLEGMSQDERRKEVHNLCASYQQAIVDILVAKIAKAAEAYSCQQVLITGGVSANSLLRKMSQEWAEKSSVELLMPPLRYCTDNAAMIGYAGILRLNRGEASEDTLGPSPRSLPGDFCEVDSAN